MWSAAMEIPFAVQPAKCRQRPTSCGISGRLFWKSLTRTLGLTGSLRENRLFAAGFGNHALAIVTRRQHIAVIEVNKPKYEATSSI